MAQNFFNCMQFFRKFGKIICWLPPGGLAPPPMGNPGSAPAPPIWEILDPRLYHVISQLPFQFQLTPQWNSGKLVVFFLNYWKHTWNSGIDPNESATSFFNWNSEWGLWNTSKNVKVKSKCIGGSKRGTREGPGGPNSFNFMQFLGKNGQIIASFRVDAPSLGKSWIRHWNV